MTRRVPGVSAAHSTRSLQQVVLHRIRMPLRRTLRSGHGAETSRELVLVEVTDHEGSIGWGECSALSRPTYSAEYTAGAWAVLRDELAPALLEGRDAGVVGHPMAAAAVDCAVRDASLRRRGRSLVDHVSASLGAARRSVPFTAVIGRGAIDEVVASVDEALEDGAVAVELKVTSRPEDLESVAVVRAHWPDVDLAVDGNGTLDLRSVRVLAANHLLYVEQPAPADDLVASAEIARSGGVAVALDESVVSVAALRTAVALGAVDVVNVKPSRLGGLGEAVAVVLAAEDLGLACFVGGMSSTGIGRAESLALAASCRFVLPADLGPSSRYFERDVTASILADDAGSVIVPAGGGLGLDVDREHLRAVTLDREIVTSP